MPVLCMPASECETICPVALARDIRVIAATANRADKQTMNHAGTETKHRVRTFDCAA